MKHGAKRLAFCRAFFAIQVQAKTCTKGEVWFRFRNGDPGKPKAASCGMKSVDCFSGHGGVLGCSVKGES